VFFATKIIQAHHWRRTFVSFVMLLLSTREGSSSYLNMSSRRKNGSHQVNLVRQDVKRSGSEDPILPCECLYAVDFADKYRPAYSGGGGVENKTSDNGAIPSRWMAYEAMLAGLVMKPFWGGIIAKDLQPNIGEDSMTRFYKLIEYLYFIKWEDHSEDRPPLLTSDEQGDKLPTRHFSRSVVFFSLVSTYLNDFVTKELPSQPCQADIRPPKVAFICVPTQ
jgi:hypothetical protein